MKTSPAVTEQACVDRASDPETPVAAPVHPPPLSGAAQPTASTRQNRRPRPTGALRPLGPKAAALQARRQRLARQQQAQQMGPQRSAEGCRLASDDGSVVFLLRAVPSGLCIERTQHRATHLQVIQRVFFASDASFRRWCAEEPTRFDHPVLYQHLRSEGHDLLPK